METKQILFDKERPLSWSAISSFLFDREQWWKKYCLHGKCRRDKGDEKAFCMVAGRPDPHCPVVETSPEMLFGNYIGNKLATDPKFLPEVPRFDIFEKEFKVKFGDITLVGFLDAFCPVRTAIREYKTSSNKNKWTYKSVMEHGQLKFYKLLIWIALGVLPENIFCTLSYIPVRKVGNFKTGFRMELSEDPVQTWEAKHTRLEVVEFGNFIKKTFREMDEYALNHRPVSIA